jgi:succinate-semialdehyde dehydrogenase/glutarate-semialdehyde dehydrogenase
MLVHTSADIDMSVNAAIASKFRNAGQTCVCADRFLVHRSIQDEFVSKLVDKVKQFKIGHGMNDGVTIGPLISSSSVEKLIRKVDEAVAENAKCVLGGRALANIGPHYFEPTILINVCPDSSIFSTENFGPIVAIKSFDTEEEALIIANNTTSGLASYFCTNDISRVFRFSASLENGIVGVNEGIISTATAPFGGVKESGLGREGSAMGINEYLETKYIFLNV